MLRKNKEIVKSTESNEKNEKNEKIYAGRQA